MFDLVSELSFEIMNKLFLSLSMPLNILEEGNMDKQVSDLVYHLCFRNKELMMLLDELFQEGLK